MTNDVIDRLRTDRELEEAKITAAARLLWQGFTKDEKTLVRFGMFPAEKMREAEKQLTHIREYTRLLAVALMDCAKADGGMCA